MLYISLSLCALCIFSPARMSHVTAATALPAAPLLTHPRYSLHPLVHPRRYQLIYAVGSPAQLPALNERVTVIQALLRAFNRLALAARPQASPSSPSTPSAGESAKAGAAEATANLPGSSGNSSSSGHQLLCADIAVFSPPAASGGGGGATQPAGGWCGLRLLPGAALESGLPQLLRCLVWELLARPPHRLAWLQAHPRRVRAVSKGRVLGYICLLCPQGVCAGRLEQTAREHRATGHHMWGILQVAILDPDWSKRSSTFRFIS